MASPVVHFEILGSDYAGLKTFYAGLFGWSLEATEGVDYALVDTGVEGALRGGIGGSPDGTPAVNIYVQVPDINATLEQVQAAGGTVLMGRTEMEPVTIAMFTDPQGNRIGLVEGE